MKKIVLGRTGLEVSVVSLGTWSYGGEHVNASGNAIGWKDHDPDLARKALIRCHELGINHWDTADVYGDGRSEQLLASVWGDVPRDNIVLASKVGWDKGGHDRWYHPDMMRDHMERSLRNLATDCIDIHYLHHCHFGKKGIWFDSALEMMHRFRDEGKIRWIGLSDWDPAAVARYLKQCDPDVVQPYRCVSEDTWISSGLSEMTREANIGAAFFSPLRHGLLLGKHESPPQFPQGDFRNTMNEFQDAEYLRLMKENADRIRARFPNHPQAVLHALIGVLLEDSPLATVLVGMRSPAHAEAAAAAAEPLGAEDAAWVRSLYQRV